MTMTPIDSSEAATQSSDIGKAIKALGKDTANKMEAIGYSGAATISCQAC